MSVYPPPSRYPSIFNPSLFETSVSSSGDLTVAQADATYAKLAGGQTIVAQETFSGGIKTNAVDLLSGTQLVVTAATAVFSGNISASNYIGLPTGNVLPITLDTVNNRVGINNTTPTTALDVTGTITATNLAGPLTTAAQPNITSVGTLTNVNTSGVYRINGADFLASRNTNSVSLGPSAGTTSQSTGAVALGSNAGNNTQGVDCVAIGSNAGAATQTTGAVAIGLNAGQTTQGVNAVAVGRGAGTSTQGSLAVAVGFQAGQTNQHANSVILNASGAPLNSDGTSRFFVKPVRNNTTATSLLQYDATSGEITYGPTNIAGTLTTAAQPNITSVGTLTSLMVSGNIAGTLTTAAQTNITSLGTLTSLTVSGNISAANYIGAVKTNAVDILSGTQLGVTAPITVFNGDISCTGSVDIDTLLSVPTTETATLTVSGSASIWNTLTTGNIKTSSIAPLTNTTSSYVDIKNTATGTFVTPLRILTPNTTGIQATQLILGVEEASVKAGYIQFVPNGFTSSTTYMNLGIAGVNPCLTLRNGRVGINNVTNPSYTLEVNGTASVSGDVNTTGVYQVNGATFAKLYGTNSVAIGPNAGGSGTPTSSIAIGNSAGSTTTNSNVIILNASGTALNSDGTSRFFVKPVRNDTTVTTLMGYNSTSGEITYGAVPAAPTVTTTSVASQPITNSIINYCSVTLQAGYYIGTAVITATGFGTFRFKMESTTKIFSSASNYVPVNDTSALTLNSQFYLSSATAIYISVVKSTAASETVSINCEYMKIA